MASQDIPRKVLWRQIKPLLPSRWKLVPSHQAVDNVPVPVVKLRQKTIERHPTAPSGAHLITFVVTIDASTPGITQGAEDELDDNVNEVLHSFDSLGLLWTKAEKTVDENRLAYDIDLTITSTPEE